jgi:superoxide dismutase, Cu-Zn family
LLLIKKKGHNMFTKLLCAAMGLTLTLACSMPTRSSSQAIAELKDKDGKPVGIATFRESGGGVIVNVNAKGLTPGLHAVHVHAVGKCEGPAFTSAGDHFNPRQKKHGHRSAEGAHAGDLPNMLVVQDGTGRFEVFTDAMTLRSGTTSVFDADGSALIVHAGIDDYATDPTGNAGDRAVCGVITPTQS